MLFSRRLVFYCLSSRDLIAGSSKNIKTTNTNCFFGYCGQATV
nr:palindromic element RPE4 domain-containing protein [Rickettsia tamurae]